MNRSTLLRKLAAPVSGLAIVAGLLVAAAPSASAAPIGTLTFNGLTAQDVSFTMTTSGGCPDGATNFLVKLEGGDIPSPSSSPNLTGNTSGGTISGGINAGPFIATSSKTLLTFASGNGLAKLGDGTYTATLVCRTALSSTSLGDYVGTFTISNSGATVTPALPAENTQTVVTTSAASDTAEWGVPVTVTATVSSTVTGSTNVPTGSVQFKADGTNLGSSVNLVNGVATTVASNLALGSRTLTAVYTPSGNFNASTSADKTITVALTAVPTQVIAPSISGVRVGSTATCTPGTWNLATGYRYEFLLNGAVVQDSTTLNTRAVTASDFGKTLACRVTATNPNGSSTPATTAAAGVAAGPAPVASTKPRIVYSGTAIVGRTFTASKGVWSPSATYTYNYIWKRGTVIVKQGATATTYRASSLDKGKVITVTVQAKRTGYATGQATSAGVKVS